MIHLVNAANMSQYKHLMEDAFALRHRVFVDEMQWEDLRSADNREIDQFDGEHALHMLYLQDDTVLGYQRMLPTVRPHLLSDVLPQLCEDELPHGHHIWEWTRYCVEPAHRERGRKLSPVANALLSGIVEWGLATGVNTIVIEMNPLWLLRLVQLHFRVRPLGLPQQVGKDEVVAVTAGFDPRTLARLREMRGSSETVLAHPVDSSYRLAG